MATTTDFNINPQPQYGQGAFGMVPGATGLAPNIYQQLQGAYSPFMSQLGQAGSNISSELAGEVDMPSLARSAAAYGIGSGMPGSGQAGTVGLNMTQQAQQQMKRQGLQDYLGLTGALGGMQTPQGLATSLSQSNAQLAAAPNPQAAYQQMFNDYMNMRNNPAGGTGYGGGRPSGQQLFNQIQGSQQPRDMSWFYDNPSGGYGTSSSQNGGGDGWGYAPGDYMTDPLWDTTSLPADDFGYDPSSYDYASDEYWY